jgi:hypothetical protein
LGNILDRAHFIAKSVDRQRTHLDETELRVLLSALRYAAIRVQQELDKREQMGQAAGWAALAPLRGQPQLPLGQWLETEDGQAAWAKWTKDMPEDMHDIVRLMGSDNQEYRDYVADWREANELSRMWPNA